MPQVLNKRVHGLPEGAVYIGRPSKFGNPFSHLPDTLAKYKVGSRDEAIAAYEAWLFARPALLEAAKLELRDKDLVCWCAPARCHGDVLLAIANEQSPQ